MLVTDQEIEELLRGAGPEYAERQGVAHSTCPECQRGTKRINTRGGALKMRIISPGNQSAGFRYRFPAGDYWICLECKHTWHTRITE